MKKIINSVVVLTIIFSNVFVPEITTYGNTKEYVTIDGEKYDTNFDISKGYIKGIEDGGIDGYAKGLENYVDSTEYTYSDFVDKAYKKATTNATIKGETYTFFNGYKKGYYLAYEKAFALGSANEEYVSMNKPIVEEEVKIIVEEPEEEKTATTGETAGAEAGTEAGHFNGEADYFNGKNISYAQTSLMNFKNEKSLATRYDFDRMYVGYGNEFTTAFDEAYMLAYIESFTALSTGLTVKDYVYHRIRSDGQNWSLEKDIGDGVETILTIEIPEGAIYGEAYIGADLVTKRINYPTNRLLYVTPGFSINAFNVNNQSRSEYVTFYKPIVLKIPHYGSDQAGIYELRDGVWNYLYTEIAEGEITHTINPKNYYGGVYTVFIENNYKKFKDTSLSWANKEIYTLARRGNILSTSNNLYPTGYMTRREFVYLVNKIKNPNNTTYTIDKEFEDVSRDDVAYNAVNFMVSNGYMNGTSDNTFSLDKPITYKQIGDVLHKVTDYNFSWTLVENSMKNDKFYMSKGTKDKNRNITREEVIYTLYYLFE